MDKFTKSTIKIDGKEKVCVLPGEYLSPEEYVQDLINQMKKDIYPLFNVKGNAPFTISRNIFCFIDHVSCLKYGYLKKTEGEQTIRIKKMISEFASFDSYINNKYKIYAPYIVQIYRHDLVHNIRPFPHKIKIIKKGKSVKVDMESWFLISSDIGNDYPKPKTFNKLAEYFINTSNRKGLCHLRCSNNQIVINNYCLFFDLINFLYEYKALLKNGDEQDKFAKNYVSIVDRGFNKIKDFTLDKNEDKECKIYFS